MEDRTRGESSHNEAPIVVKSVRRRRRKRFLQVVEIERVEHEECGHKTREESAPRTSKRRK